MMGLFSSPSWGDRSDRASGKDDAATAARHIRTLAKAVAQSKRDQAKAEAIWKASKGKSKGW